MVFARVDGHVSVANSLALEKAGITRDTPNPPGGEIERDPATRQPTGLLKENAMNLVESKIPPLSPAERRRAIELALAEAARYGVTSLQDNSEWEDFLVYEQLKKEGKLTVRITEWLPFLTPLERLEEMRRRGGTTDPWLKTGALKAITDGSLGSRTAAMLAPFADDPSSTGILRIPYQELKAKAIERDKAGFQLAFHAIGDRANRLALDAFAAVRAANGKRDARHRIEHAQVVAPEDFPRFAALDVIASMQPCHETTDMRWAEAHLGPERSKGAYAWNSMLKHGVRLAFGTDYPVEPINPLRGLYACVTRALPPPYVPQGRTSADGPARRSSKSAGGWQPQEKISVEDCIHAYTLGSAYAEFEENNKGQLAAGKFADLVVLSADVTRIPADQILHTEVLMTLVGGRVVYEAPSRKPR
jgi:predicted amidohydrolase YtcJ